jgi:hypothetical protein
MKIGRFTGTSTYQSLFSEIFLIVKPEFQLANFENQDLSELYDLSEKVYAVSLSGYKNQRLKMKERIFAHKLCLK